MLKLIKETSFGKKYSIAGSLPFDMPLFDQLNWGDIVQDNDGKGMICYVNQCCYCSKKFLGSTLCLIRTECSDKCWRTLAPNISRALLIKEALDLFAENPAEFKAFVNKLTPKIGNYEF